MVVPDPDVLEQLFDLAGGPLRVHHLDLLRALGHTERNLGGGITASDPTSVAFLRLHARHVLVEGRGDQEELRQDVMDGVAEGADPVHVTKRLPVRTRGIRHRFQKRPRTQLVGRRLERARAEDRGEMAPRGLKVVRVVRQRAKDEVDERHPERPLDVLVDRTDALVCLVRYDLGELRDEIHSALEILGSFMVHPSAPLPLVTRLYSGSSARRSSHRGSGTNPLLSPLLARPVRPIPGNPFRPRLV